MKIAWQALKDPERGYGKLNVQLEPDALDHLVDVANGDARGVLNALELAVETTEADENGRYHITLAVAEEPAVLLAWRIHGLELAGEECGDARPGRCVSLRLAPQRTARTERGLESHPVDHRPDPADEQVGRRAVVSV